MGGAELVPSGAAVGEGGEVSVQGEGGEVSM